jgi:hypothetical protein
MEQPITFQFGISKASPDLLSEIEDCSVQTDNRPENTIPEMWVITDYKDSPITTRILKPIIYVKMPPEPPADEVKDLNWFEALMRFNTYNEPVPKPKPAYEMFDYQFANTSGITLRYTPEFETVANRFIEKFETNILKIVKLD